jgi:tetratricopeptide (TPR) repeat protein
MIVMAAPRRLLLILLLMLVAPGAFAQKNEVPKIGAARGAAGQNPAEFKSYSDAINIKDAIRRAQALEIFIAWYPNSTLRIDAYEQLMAAWQLANNPDKADAAAIKLLQIDPDNVRALVNRAYVGRTRAAAGDSSALATAVAAAERGFTAATNWKKPETVGDREFAKLRLQVMAIFNGVMGFAALQAKDYAKARRYFLDSVSVDPDNLQDVYQLSIAQLESAPTEPLGFWYAAHAIALARAARNDSAAASIDKYARSRYARYHGSEQGWDAVIAAVAEGERVPPDGFAHSISRQMTPEERAIQLVTDNDPGNLSYADWEAVLIHRDASAANRDAAERVWRAIADKQRGGEARLKVPMKVISAQPEHLQGAISEENQTSGTADLDVMFARPLSPLPARGAKISIVGTLVDYRLKPFVFLMTGAELAPESMSVAGGTCADPRPQICTRDYRPACGLRLDKTSRTYGNACSACADPEVVSQSGGACPER